MIPAGITPADDVKAAEIFGIGVGHWRDTKRWTTIRGLQLLNRKDARRRIFSLQQLRAAKAEEERAAAVNELPKYNLPPVPTEESPRDLLDLVEARLALPKERRPTPSTWSTYRFGTKTKLPEPDVTINGEGFWYRQTILDWDANRPGRGSVPGRGRHVGAKDKQPRRRGATAARRKERVRELLDERGSGLTAAEVQADLGISEGHASRLLKDAPAKQGVNTTAKPADARLKRVRELLNDRGPNLTVDDVRAGLGTGKELSRELLHAARAQKVRELLHDQPRLTTDDVKAALGLNVTAHAQKLLDEVRAAQ